MHHFSQQLTALAETVVRAALQKKIRLATAESCTGGLIGACLTEIAGASEVFDQGFVTYSYESKTSQLGVPPKTILDCGAVSAETARAMAEGALNASTADIAVSATGIAGPGGATPGKPVGLVYLGIAVRKGDKSYALKNNFSGDRATVRLKTVETALRLLKKEIESP
jgi:nicotinamide-nucleotide amidase